MSVQKLPSGRYRATVLDPITGKRITAAGVLNHPEPTFSTRSQARDAVALARKVLGTRKGSSMTVAEWAHIWTTDPLYRRPKDSTNKLRQKCIAPFVKQYGDLPMDKVDDEIVAGWIRGGKNISAVANGLRPMFSDASSPKAGRVIKTNPFARLGLGAREGRKNLQPPTEDMVRNLIAIARVKSSPDFAAWLQVACFTGMRPGELDGLEWGEVDFDRSRIRVAQQFNAMTLTFTTPKNGRVRSAPLTQPAREALEAMPTNRQYAFKPLRAEHWTNSSRRKHWDAVRHAAGITDPLYLWTRHFSASWMVNVLRMTPEDVAVALGHEDGGYLIRTLYGHLEREDALDRVVAAASGVADVIPITRKQVG